MNSISPQEIYGIIKSTQIGTPLSSYSSEVGQTVSSGSNTGLGRKTLTEVCTELNFDPAVMVSELTAKGVAADACLTLKAIAAKDGKSPTEIYQIILTIADHR